MYVVGQFPNFLTGHWPFLKTVIKKLNEFMHEKHPGVQDMASETFLKISKLTKHMFTQVHEQNTQPYVFDLINMVPEICKDLEEKHELMVYEGIGYMISTDSHQQPQLINGILQYSNADWQGIIQNANGNSDTLMNSAVIQKLDHIIKINQRIAQSVGQQYLSYLGNIYNDIMSVYSYYSKFISSNALNS